MTDNNATQPAEKVGPIRQWIKDHPNIWEFIPFNVLSNISTITRFVVTCDRHRHLHQWHGLDAAVPLPDLQLRHQATVCGFLTFLLAEALAQVVNFFVQMKWVFKSDSSFK